jgi:hypothetical protein
VTTVVVPDGERVVTPLPRDLNYHSLLQIVDCNEFPADTETRLHMHWRIRTPYRFLIAVYTEFAEIFNEKHDAYIGPSFM